MARHQLFITLYAMSILATAIQGRPYQHAAHHSHEHFHELYHQNRQKLIVHRVTDFVMTTVYQDTPVQATPASVSLDAAITTTTTTTSSSLSNTPSTAPAASSCTSASSACTGSITLYTPGAGLGSCGWSSDGTLQNVIALPPEFMDAEADSSSPDSSSCGRTIELYNPATGIRANGTVVDRCVSCSGSSLDLSAHLFGEMTQAWEGRESESWGQVGGITWWFGD